jgi:hypothetical protein
MIEFLKNNELVNPEANEDQIEGFLAKQIPAKNGYEFYSLLRHESETKKSKKKKSKTASKTTTKTKKKTKKVTRKK